MSFAYNSYGLNTIILNPTSCGINFKMYPDPDTRPITCAPNTRPIMYLIPNLPKVEICPEWNLNLSYIMAIFY